MTTLVDYIRRNGSADGVGLRFGDDSWSHREVFAEATCRANYLLGEVGAETRHVGVLLDNTPDAIFWLQGAFLAGMTVVGLNSTRRGDDLHRDIQHTDCAIVVTDDKGLSLLGDVALTTPRFMVDAAADDARLAAYRDQEPPPTEVAAEDCAVLIFTSGTTSAPKAAIRSHGRLLAVAEMIVEQRAVTAADVIYSSMPWFHSNALYISITPAIRSGATLVVAERFSASGFIRDVRRYSVTGFNYVGKPLQYILATAPSPDDADNTLRYAMGNEANEKDIAAFAERFGVEVTDGFGSTEGGVGIFRTPDTPPGSLGKAPDESVAVLDPATGEPCPPARFGPDGRVTNAEEAIGELVNTTGGASFEGYYNNEAATAERIRGGMYWSGDLGYRDENGFFYFAGRGYDWIRVDGENFAAAPVERVLLRSADIVQAAVYAVPDPHVGDRVFAAIQLGDGASFDPQSFSEFLSAQTDMGAKWSPTFVRVMDALPLSHTNKIQKRQLRSELWHVADAVWWRPTPQDAYRPLTDADRRDLEAQFARSGRTAALSA